MEKERFEGILDPLLYPDQTSPEDQPLSETPEWWETAKKTREKNRGSEQKPNKTPHV